jgi:iron complex transport system permease protein
MLRRAAPPDSSPAKPGRGTVEDGGGGLRDENSGGSGLTDQPGPLHHALPLRRGGILRRGDAPLLAVLVVLVVLLFVLSLAIGPVSLPPATVAAALVGRASPAANIIVVDIRLPRALLGLLIGGSLGLSGAAMQGLLRNPLAAPSLFGAPAAAAFGAVAVISLGLVDALSFALPIAAIAGALVSVGLLLLVAGPRASLLVLILAGLAISSLAGAGTSLALNLAPNPFAALEIAFWLLGSLEDRSFRHVLIALPFMAAGTALLFVDRRAFRALTLGEEAAASLGFDLTRVRLRVVAGVAAAVGAGVAVAGSIGFVGLVAPHLMRPFVKYDPGRLLVPATLSGAALLLAADIVVRLIPSQGEIRVGVVTALIGAPFFIGLIMRRRHELTGEAS